MGIIAVILGLLAIFCAILATFIFGTVGGIVAGVLGAGAIALSFLKMKKSGKGGKAGIVIGAIAVVLAFTMTNTWTKAFKEMHDKAVQYKPDGLWAQVTDGDVSGGLYGIIRKLPNTEEATVNALVDEMTELSKIK